MSANSYLLGVSGHFEVVIYTNSGTVTIPDEDDEYDLEDAVIKEINHAEKYLVVV